MTEEKKPYAYVPVPDEEIAKLAAALIGGSVFTSMHIEPTLDNDNWSHVMHMVFMPLALGVVTGSMRAEILKHNVIFYEYLDKAGPRSVNGYPCFLSMRMISMAQWQQVVERARKALEVIGAAPANDAGKLWPAGSSGEGD